MYIRTIFNAKITIIAQVDIIQNNNNHEGIIPTRKQKNNYSVGVDCPYNAFDYL